MIEGKYREVAEKYPFLVQYDCVGDDYLAITPDESGWMKLFFYLLMDEIKEDMERTDQKELTTLQVKSKYGEFRWYTGSIAKESKIFDIIDKYSHISRNCCEMCGKPDVPITKGYWIMPICRKCYEANEYNKDTPYEEAMDMEYDKIPEVIHYKKFSPDSGSVDCDIDISDTVRRVRENWNKNHPDDQVQVKYDE